MSTESREINGVWEDLVTRPEFRGHQVKITIIDQPSASTEPDDWLASLHCMANNDVRIVRPADDSRVGIYEGSE